ncbi:NADP-dependent glutamate dehydrogenase [Emydomyces testavorans]|uniref:Glutamate dehydrogenase n=1 Tax=Emydomyces testavorans TaxID=2070801 RepID=A0AAF0DBK4_9EURO|nr:NADP-dependent glutamate dehydrogenase [Emydomyces testavorans]
MGGGKGGADFDPKGKSDNEIRKFCSAFMMELSKHIGADIDVPAGDIGVGGREIGFLFGAYKRQRHIWEGVLTGKGLSWGGSLIRPEATGYGLVYVRICPIIDCGGAPANRESQYVQHMIQYATDGQESFKGKRVAISGSGNVAQYAALKVIEFGGTVISISDSKGSLVVRNKNDSITPEEIFQIQKLKDQRKQLSALADTPNFKDRCAYLEGARPWLHVDKVDVALPCATQNEVSGPEALTLIQNGCKYIAEGSNMGCTLAAIEHFEAHRQLHKKGSAVWYAPGKAANAGGVAVSGLEMAQNSQRLTWTAEEVDQKLKNIMEQCFETGVKTSENYTSLNKGQLPSLVIGSNIAGFIKVAEAMKDHGDWF